MHGNYSYIHIPHINNLCFIKLNICGIWILKVAQDWDIAGIFTQIRSVWIGYLGSRPKNRKTLCLGSYITLCFLGFPTLLNPKSLQCSFKNPMVLKSCLGHKCARVTFLTQASNLLPQIPAKLKRSQLIVCTVYVYCVRCTLFPLWLKSRIE